MGSGPVVLTCMDQKKKIILVVALAKHRRMKDSTLKTDHSPMLIEKNLLRLALAILWVTAAARRYIVTYSDGVVAGKLS